MEKVEEESFQYKPKIVKVGDKIYTYDYLKYREKHLMQTKAKRVSVTCELCGGHHNTSESSRKTHCNSLRHQWCLKYIENNNIKNI